MKAFIAITLLVASVAAQSYDFDYKTTSPLHRDLLTRDYVQGHKYNDLYNTLISKNFYGRHGVSHRYTVDDLLNIRRPTVSSVFDQDYSPYTTDSLLTFDQIIQHPLFQTYYSLPYFRQHFGHPLFQHYLTTPYFQLYFTNPNFPQFFRSAQLFYKYIYPVVFKTVEGHGYDQDLYSDVVVPKDYSYAHVNPFHVKYPVNAHHVKYAYVLDNVFKTYFVGKPITEVKTDVKVGGVTPVEEQTYGKYVDPITGETKYTFGDLKTVEKKIVPVIDNVFESIQKPVESDVLLKRLLLNKRFAVDSDLVNKYRYQSVYPRDLISKYESVYPRDYVNKYETAYPRDLINKYNSGYVRDLINAIYPVNRYESVYPRHFVNKYESVYPRDILNKYESVYPRDLVNKFESVYPRDLVNKYESVYPRDLVNKYESVFPREYVNRHIDSVIPRAVSVLRNIDTLKKIDNTL